MPCDALTYQFVVTELNKILSGGRIDKISMPQKDTIILSIRSLQTNYSLFISANANSPACYITAQSFENPLKAPSFLMCLRKNIGGGKIKSITQIPFERIIIINIVAKNELGYESDKSLVVEIMNKHSNIILLDSEKRIIECIKHITPEISSKRLVLPSLGYALAPQQGKLDLQDKEKVLSFLDAFEGGRIDAYLQSGICGLSPRSIKESVFNTFGENNFIKKDDFFAHKIYDELSKLYDEKTIKPAIGYIENKPIDFFVRAYNSVKADYKFTNTINEAMDEYYTLLSLDKKLSHISQKLTTLVKASITKAEKRLSVFLDNIESAKNMENDRLFGELLTANMYKVKYGMDCITLENYYADNERVTIALDSKLSPSKNAQKYYRLYNKKKKTAELSIQKAAECENELDYLESVLQNIALATNELELAEITKELEISGYKPKDFSPAKKKNQKSTDAEFKTFFVDGYEILVGKNNVQNDRLVKSSMPNDIWLHTKNIHGCHVVIKTRRTADIESEPSALVPNEVLVAAAETAAYFSKARLSQNVLVDYTFVKHVSKPKNSLPGKVVYTNQKTLSINPKQHI